MGIKKEADTNSMSTTFNEGENQSDMYDIHSITGMFFIWRTIFYIKCPATPGGEKKNAPDSILALFTPALVRVLIMILV